MSLIDEDHIKVWLTGEFERIEKAANKPFIIGGYASVLLEDEDGNEIPDMQDDSIDLDALDESFNRMMKRPSRRNLNAKHTSAQIGEIIPEYTDSEGVKWRSHVVRTPDTQYVKKGLFVLGELFDDMLHSLRYRAAMIKGHMLSFSIGGEVLAKKLICNGVKCFQKITFLDLHEVSACEQGVNPEAKSFVLKGDESHTLLSECKDGAELLSRLRNY